MDKRIKYVSLVALVVFSATLARQIGAADEDTGWSDTAELSWVSTSGNSESSTIGFKNLLTRRWEEAEFNLRAGGVRVSTKNETRSAVGIPTSFIEIKEGDDETTAENYFLNGRYDREISERFFWYTGAGWERNRFAGIKNRYSGQGGVGNIWLHRDDVKFRTDYALTYTDEENVAGRDENFLGARFSWDYQHQFLDSTRYQNVLIIDENLDETDDIRADMLNAVTVTMNDRFALQVSLLALWDNKPALERIDLKDPATGTTIGNVLVELEEFDTVFTASLVVNFD